MADSSNSNSEIGTFGFDAGDDDIKGGMYEKYKGKKGEIHRLGIIYSDPKAMFAGSKIHFKDRYFLCKGSVCCEKLGPPKHRIAAAVIKYGTDKTGNVKKPLSYEILPWLFSEATYSKLKNLNSEFPLASHDIKIACDNDDYQHLNITPCNECIWIAKEDIKKQILNEAKPIWDFAKKSIAANLSIEEINDLLGSGSGTVADPTSKVNLDEVLSDM